MLRGEYEISVYLLRLLLDICTYVLNSPIPGRLRVSKLFIRRAENGNTKSGKGRRIYPDGDYLLALRPCATACMYLYRTCEAAQHSALCAHRQLFIPSIALTSTDFPLFDAASFKRVISLSLPFPAFSLRRLITLLLNALLFYLRAGS